MKKLNKITIIAIIAGAVILAAVILLLVAEANIAGKIVIKNKTDKDITGITVYFDDESGDVDQVIFTADEIKSGKTLRGDIEESYNYTGRESSCCVLLQFEGGNPLFVYDGYFDGVFSGKITLEFNQKGDDVYFIGKAVDNLFGHVVFSMDCNEKMNLDTLSEDDLYAEEFGDDWRNTVDEVFSGITDVVAE